MRRSRCNQHLDMRLSRRVHCEPTRSATGDCRTKRVTTGAAEIETNKTSFSKSKRLAFLASFNPRYHRQGHRSRCHLSTVLRSSNTGRDRRTSEYVNTNLWRHIFPGVLKESAWLTKKPN